MPPFREHMSGTIWWQDDHPALTDQARLPFEEVVLHCHSTGEMAEAITSLRVRGAPSIGVAAAYGVAHAAQTAALTYSSPAQRDAFRQIVLYACTQMAATRPTAVHIFFAISRMTAMHRAMA